MPRKKKPGSAFTPELQLKTLALRNDPDVQAYRDIHYLLFMDSAAWQGHIPNGEKPTLLSPAKHKQLFRQHQKLIDQIFKKYRLAGWSLGDPFCVRKGEWLSTLQATQPEPMTHDANWQTSFSLHRVVVTIPDGSKRLRSRGVSVSSLPVRPLNAPPTLSVRVDLSRINTRDLDRLASEFKRQVKQHLDDVPKDLRKPPSPWEQNVERDYSRFRLHQQGMSFRWIAYQERTGRAPSGPVTGPVPTESSVRESVERVHLILFDKKYSARRHKTSLREIPLKQACDNFKCPLHGRDDCPLACQHAQNFMQQIKPLQEPLLK